MVAWKITASNDNIKRIKWYPLFQMRVKTIFTLLGVAFFQTPCICVDQSGFEGNTQPMTVKERRDTPEVILQLKYDGGELNKIYLTQFRKESNPIPTTVPTRASLCADLCHSGSYFIFVIFVVFFFVFKTEHELRYVNNYILAIY